MIRNVISIIGLILIIGIIGFAIERSYNTQEIARR